MSKYVHIVLIAILALVCLGLSMAMVGAVFYGMYLAGVAFFSLPTYIWVSVIAALFVVGVCIDSKDNFLVLFDAVKKGVVSFVTESLKALEFASLKENKSDQAKAVVNSLTWSAVVYGVTSYIMAPAGTMFVAMLGANVVPALSLAFVVYAAAAGLVKHKKSIATFAKVKKKDTVKLFNVKSPNEKLAIFFVSVIVGPVLVVLSVAPVFVSGMAIFATSIMQALTVATSLIVTATVWRTLDKALHNKHNNVEANKDSWAKIALKALGVILFAAVAYSLAAILPMFAGLVLPTWSALASAFAVVSVPGVFVATISAAYATNIATYYAKGDYQPVENLDDDLEKKTTAPAPAPARDLAPGGTSVVPPTPASAKELAPAQAQAADDKAPAQGSKARSVDSQSDVVLPDPTPSDN